MAMGVRVTRPLPKKRCPDCDGFGDVEGQLQGRETVPCETCKATGEIYDTGDDDEPKPSDGFGQPMHLKQTVQIMEDD